MNLAIGYLGRWLTIELLGLRILNLLIINYSLLNEEVSKRILVVDGNSWRTLKEDTNVIKLCVRHLWHHMKTNLELGEIICEDRNQAWLQGDGKVRRQNCQAWEPHSWWIWPECSWDSFLSPLLSLLMYLCKLIIIFLILHILTRYSESIFWQCSRIPFLGSVGLTGNSLGYAISPASASHLCDLEVILIPTSMGRH